MNPNHDLHFFWQSFGIGSVSGVDLQPDKVMRISMMLGEIA